jgi:hypothetical protein
MYANSTRVTTKVVIHIETGKVLKRKSYRYFGPWALACGGPTAQQQSAATSTSDIDSTLANMFQTDATQTQPFYTNLLQQGLPYFNQQSQYSSSDLAQQEGQQQAALKSRLTGQGSTLPSGFASQEETDLQGQTAEAFDQNQLNLLQQQQQAKMAGAAGLNPLASASTAISGNQSIMQAPLQNSFWSNLIGGILGSGAGGDGWSI